MTHRTHLDLFSGIGGFALACRWAGVETVGFAEIDDYASRVLAKNFPGVPNYGDVRNVPGSAAAWLVTGGFPCQPFSVAGKQGGASDDRYLWPEMARVIERTGPTWVLAENVPGIIGMELDTMLSDLERIGYTAWPVVVPACAVGAVHRRDRVWIIANANGKLSTSEGGTIRRGWRDMGEAINQTEKVTDWTHQPAMVRMVDEVSKKLDRIRRLNAIGNAIVPQVAYQLIRFMVQAEDLG